MALLDRVTLSEQQEDQIFAIIHDASPSVRQNAKQLGKAYERLHKLAFSSEYSQSEVETLGRAVGDAEAQSAQLRAQLDHDITRVLTLEQRRSLEERGRNDRRCDCENRSTSGPPAR
jgi:periplasmic protein CpxP/Spy